MDDAHTANIDAKLASRFEANSGYLTHVDIASAWKDTSAPLTERRAAIISILRTSPVAHDDFGRRLISDLTTRNSTGSINEWFERVRVYGKSVGVNFG